LDTLRSAFRDGLALPRGFDATRAETATLAQWDSVGHLQLVIAIEDAFGVRLAPADVVELTSFPRAVEILKRRGAWADA
jgi:acyl carrier protein